jgi:hypothetical protein
MSSLAAITLKGNTVNGRLSAAKCANRRTQKVSLEAFWNEAFDDSGHAREHKRPSPHITECRRDDKAARRCQKTEIAIAAAWELHCARTETLRCGGA